MESEVILTNGKIIQGPEVSDHAIALLLSITRNLNYIAKNKISDMPRPIELRGKTALILGMGGIGIISRKIIVFWNENNRCGPEAYSDEFVYR